jgi:hypothetical protein
MTRKAAMYLPTWRGIDHGEGKLLSNDRPRPREFSNTMHTSRSPGMRKSGTPLGLLIVSSIASLGFFLRAVESFGSNFKRFPIEAETRVMVPLCEFQDLPGLVAA